MEGGREQNYWPGFVDALSNVVLTLVFVLVIFVFALVMASSKVEKKMQEIVTADQAKKSEAAIAETLQQANTQQIEALKQQLAAATAEVEKLRAAQVKDASDTARQGAANQNAVDTTNEEKHIAIENKDQAKQQQGTIQINHSADKIVLGFPLSVTDMDEKSATELGHVLDASIKNVGKHKILLRSIIGKEPYSAARRLAYYRAITARNILITKENENPSTIVMTIVQPPQPEDGRVEIVIQKE